MNRFGPGYLALFARVAFPSWINRTRRAVREGTTALNDIKKRTRMGMGYCQGKMCAANVLKLYAHQTGQPVKNLRVPTMRPPLEPIPPGGQITEIDEGQDA